MAEGQEEEDAEVDWTTRAGRRRARLQNQRRTERRRASRNAYVDAQLEPGEPVLARSLSGTHNSRPKAFPGTVVTDRRIIFAWARAPGPHTGEWTHDSIRYDEIIRWTLARQHDARPLIMVDHPVHVRLENVHDKRRFFWTYGNGEGEVEHTRTMFPGRSERHPVFVAMRDQLVLADIPQGESFELRPEGTRAQRMKGSAGGQYRVN